MSVKLRDNNPNIADLSDDFRPTKLQEMFSELYDNEWTSAFAVLQDQLTERRAVEFLLDVVLLAYDFCSNELKKTWQVVCKWYIDEDTNMQLRKQLKDARKAKLSRLYDDISKEFLSFINTVCTDEKVKGMLSGPLVNCYISKSVKIALLMCACDPPVVVACPGLVGRPVYSSNVTVQEELNIPERTDVGSVENSHSQKVDVLVHSNNEQSCCSVIDVNDVELNDISESTTTSADTHPLILIDQISKSKGTLDTKTERNSIVSSTSSIKMANYGSINNATEGSSCITNQNDSAIAHAITSITSRNMTTESFGLGSPKMSSSVITKQPSKSAENAAFDRGLYREYTAKGQRVEFFVWPVLYLHVGGPLLAKGIAQGAAWGPTTDSISMWSWRTREPKANVSVENIKFRVAEEVSTEDIGNRLSEAKVSTGDIEDRLLDANASTADIKGTFTEAKAPLNNESKGSEAEVSGGDIEYRLPEAASQTASSESTVREEGSPIRDTVSRTSEARVSVGKNEDHAEETNDLGGNIETQTSDTDAPPEENEEISTNC